MTYCKPPQQQTELGASLDTIVQGVSAASKVVEDPALPEVSCLILRMNRITEGQKPGPPCTKVQYTEADKRKGIGLAYAVRPLRSVLWAREHPVASAALGAAVISGIMFVGYALGKGR